MTGLISNDDKDIKSSLDKNTNLTNDSENDWENLYDDSGESVLSKLEKVPFFLIINTQKDLKK